MKINRKNASSVRSSYLYVIDVQARANTPFLYHRPWWYEVLCGGPYRRMWGHSELSRNRPVNCAICVSVGCVRRSVEVNMIGNRRPDCFLSSSTSFLSCLETVLQTKNTLHQMWLKSLKGLKKKNSYVAYVFRRVLNSRYTKFGWNRLRG
jgi:hypothetical protein